MYIEASSNYNTGPFTLLSPTFGECVGEVSFYYHMYSYYASYYGYTSDYYQPGTLQLEETTDGVSWTTIWTKSGNHYQGQHDCNEYRWLGCLCLGHGPVEENRQRRRWHP